MSLLPFGNLPPYRDRRFVPVEVDWENLEIVGRLFDELAVRASSLTSSKELEQWVVDWGELSAALDEEDTRRYIAMTCHTEDAEAEAAYLRFVESVEPFVKPKQFELSKIFLEHPLRAALPIKRYEVFNRIYSVFVELFRQENVPLQVEESKIGQQYQKLSGSLTVTFDGEERTLIQMGKYQEEPDRSLRQETWELVARRRLQERDSFEEQYDQLLGIRTQISANAGFNNYRDYRFRYLNRFDYTPEDCLAFHQTIQELFVPLYREIQEKRRIEIGTDKLRPWDLAVDTSGRPPLRPFETTCQLVDRAIRVFESLDVELAAIFRKMRQMNLLDLDNRKGKAPGGYQSTLSEARLPFIFMNAVGIQRDVETILHEAGHAFHAFLTRDEDILAYRYAPMEFCEVASMSMELLGGEFLDAFYKPDELRRARKAHLEGIVSFFPWMAIVDSFQHWIYTHPEHDRKARSEVFCSLMDRFGGVVDWSGYEDVRANLWHRQLHIFLSPFYYVEYGIAQLGALQVWLNYKNNPALSLKAYKDALALGGSRPLPELFETAGCKFSFDAKTVTPLVSLIRAELAKLN